MSENKLPVAPGIINAGFVFRSIRRRPLLFLTILFLASTGGVLAYAVLTTPRLTAAMVFRIAPQAPTVLQGAPDQRIDLTTYRQSQTALLKSRLLLKTVLEQPEVRSLATVQEHPESLEWMEKTISVDKRLGNSEAAGAGAEFIRVSVEGNNGDDLLVILKNLARLHLAEVEEEVKGSRRRQLAQWEEALRSIEAEINTNDNRLKGLVSLSNPNASPIAYMFQAFRQQEDLIRLNAEAKTAENELKSIQRKLLEFGDPAMPELRDKKDGAVLPPTVPIPTAQIEEQLRRDPAVLDLETKIARAKSALTDLEERIKPGVENSSVNKARSDMRALESQLEALKKTRRPALEQIVRDNILESEKKVAAEKKKTWESLKRDEQAALTRLTEVKQIVDTKNLFQKDMDAIIEKIAAKEPIRQQLRTNIEMIRPELSAPTRVTLAEEPSIYKGLDANRRLKMALITGIVTLIVGFGGLFSLEYYTLRVSSATEISAGLGLELVGTIPPFISQSASRSEIQSHNTAFTEAIDTTRTVMLFGADPNQPLRTILVTSAIASEGKTSLSGHLAISLTRAGYRTLLVDGDFRAPSAHTLYETPEAPGLSEVLAGTIPTSEAIFASPIPKLFVMPAGHWSLPVHQALVGDRWRKLTEALEQEYDYIIVDTAPVLLVSDSLLMAREADGVIISVLLDHSRMASSVKLLERLRSIRANILGVVVNGVRQDNNLYGYGYRYRYRYRHPQAATNGTQAASVANLPDANVPATVVNSTPH